MRSAASSNLGGLPRAVSAIFAMFCANLRISTRLWEYDLYIEENTLTVNMTRLRKKLSGIGLTDFITTRVGSGYVVL